MPPTPLAGLLDRLADDDELVLPSLDPAELVVLGATSPLLGLTPDVPAAGGDAAGGDAALARLAERGLLVRQGEVAIGPVDAVAALLDVRARPTLIGTVSVGPHRPGDAGAPTAAAEGGQTIAVLHGVGVERVGLAGLLEEVATDSGTHRFASPPSAQAARLFEAWTDLGAESDGPLRLTCHVFVPEPEARRHAEVMLAADSGGGPRVRATRRPGRWEDDRPAGADGFGWVTSLVGVLDEVVGPVPYRPA